MIGTTIGHYKIESKLGEGGMGVVYKARDTKLNRTVALKFLPFQVSGSEQDKARFLQEAQAAAGLNHPNICTIHGIEDNDGQQFIVMEFMDGKTLKERVDESPLKVKEAIDIAVQIAQGLTAAHEKGIVHRDMKSANVMITEKGDLKIMDFGLAKIAKGSALLTKQGTTLGTIAYMSPEQARGEKVDRRSDIWSLGIILYEMLTGRLPFKGDFEQAVVYSLLNEEPEPVTSLRSGIPLELERLIAKALTKDPASRYQHADELAVDLKTIRTAIPSSSKLLKTAASMTAMPADARRRRVVSPPIIGGMVALALIVGIVIGWLGLSTPRPSPVPIVRFALHHESTTLDGQDEFGAFIVSPDGIRLVYVTGRGNNQQLFLREFDKFEAQPLPNTKGMNIRGLFFSPDSRWIGFFSRGKIMKLSLSGGTPIPICEVSDELASSADWGDNGEIVFQQNWGSGLWIVSTEPGSTPRRLTTLKTEEGEGSHLMPYVLPGSKHALFTIWTRTSFEDATVAAVDLSTGEHRTVFRGGSDVRSIQSAHLVYARGSTIMVSPFDPTKVRVTGEPTPLIENVRFSGTGGNSEFSVSQTGTLVYASGRTHFNPTKITLVEARGEQSVLSEHEKGFGGTVFSPDGRRLAVVIYGPTFHIGLYDLQRDLLTPLTFTADNDLPVWFPDGKRISFWSNIGGRYTVYSVSTDGSGMAEKVFDQEGNPAPGSWSPDGKRLAYVILSKDTKTDIWVYANGNTPTKEPFVATRANESSPQISPDGNWLAYVSDESGEAEVYVQPFPAGKGKWRVSKTGGSQPHWGPDNRRLWFLRGEEIIAVPVEIGSSAVGRTMTIGKEERVRTVESIQNFDIAKNGTLVFTQRGVGTQPKKLNVVLNWFEEWKKKVPVD
ncbi:MAG: Protein kinase protein [Bacteroidetes bacterium]|nr:Protein kinase protein [Bacteroidota bacterium]